MRALYIVILIFTLVIGFKSYAAESAFFESLYDVPIMPGLEEVPEMAMSFDKPNGRISQAAAVAPAVAEPAIIAFYQESLPQMGWQQNSRNHYVREGEELEISIEKTETSQIVRFLLKPQ
jgi:hypothetical protein